MYYTKFKTKNQKYTLYRTQQHTPPPIYINDIHTVFPHKDKIELFYTQNFQAFLYLLFWKIKV